jgi:hypothetical protein
VKEEKFERGGGVFKWEKLRQATPWRGLSGAMVLRRGSGCIFFFFYSLLCFFQNKNKLLFSIGKKHKANTFLSNVF